MPDSPKLLCAWLDSLTSGIVEFSRNWDDPTPPRLTLGAGAPKITAVAPAPELTVGRAYGYFLRPPDEFVFVLPPGHAAEIERAGDTVYLAGDFNGWQNAAGVEEWRLKPGKLDGESVLLWAGSRERITHAVPARFKFVTGEHLWLSLPNDAPNAVKDDHGNLNRWVDHDRTGRQMWRFTVKNPFDLAEPISVAMAGAPDTVVPLGFGRFFRELKTDLELGAQVEAASTRFRLFAPRARKVTLFLCDTLDKQASAAGRPLHRRPDLDGASGVWELNVEEDVQGWYYWYTVDGVREGPGRFDPTVRILDPYALAAVSRHGPGIVLAPHRLGASDPHFRTPAWQDLIIAEAHVRDLTAHAPVELTPEERRGFTGLRRWVESPEFYLHTLGVNCVELQPVQEADSAAPEEYQWGYMPTNYFAPESAYSLEPATASGANELHALISAFHRRGLAVLLDVVYNHVGNPAHLLAIDRIYYFEQDRDGQLSNWSGCGNDLRAGAAMARRLIIDSCRHLIAAYGVDGFRFDLAELLGVEVLSDVEQALKAVKPDVVLIAEPWSFRGHIAGALRPTGWASWNDGYRDFMREYVWGRGEAERLEYFLRGSPWYFAKWPAQTVNYTESHDDRTWIDMITENPDHDGSVPTANDRRRTHLMAAVLLMSIGIPMLAEGQDFLRSKRGVSNTYLQGEVNALDYRRLYRYLGTHAYFADWIAFRRGHHGRLLRQFSRPGEGFFQFFRSADGKATAMLVNADRSQGTDRLLFAVNPTQADATIPMGPDPGPWRQVADQERFYAPGGLWPVEPNLLLPALSCGLWVSVP